MLETMFDLLLESKRTLLQYKYPKPINTPTQSLAFLSGSLETSQSRPQMIYFACSQSLVFRSDARSYLRFPILFVMYLVIPSGSQNTTIKTNSCFLKERNKRQISNIFSSH